MAKLSVNLNKVATLRNARGGSQPSVLEATQVCLDAGVRGITLHARADERHIRRGDVYEVAELLRHARNASPDLELNIEGDPRPEWLSLVHEVRPEQATLVPVREGELTSEAGWSPSADPAAMSSMIRELRDRGSRVSLFIDPTLDAVRWAKRMGADRVELYTEPFARAFMQSEAIARASFVHYVDAANEAHALGLGVNAGHDLDLDNLLLFRECPHLDEVSIGHALISRALFVGLDKVAREYLRVLAGK
ncbi:MAG TPA: pyridoxine 5'-phosphate synthase [Polyangiales bacterium]|nr:pyridoxine 5'-phosphate synthase [Polyangiales bacterium]